MIFTIKFIITRSAKFHPTALKDTKATDVLSDMAKAIPLNSGCEKKYFQKELLCFQKSAFLSFLVTYNK